MKAVLDTNVLISGMLWKGTPEKILRAWKDQKYSLVLSLPAMAGLQRMLRYPRIGMPEEMIHEWVELLLENALLVEPRTRVHIIKEDTSDNMFLEAALAGSVDYLVSGDKHLLNIGNFQGIKIVRPAQFYSHL